MFYFFVLHYVKERNSCGKMSADEDLRRGQVLSLYSRCDNDLALMMERIVRVLQEAGRHDIKIGVESDGAMITVTQAHRHSRVGGTNDFLRRLNQQLDSSRPGVADPKRMRELINAIVTGKAEPAAAGVPAEAQLSEKPHRSGFHRCFPLTEKDRKLRSFPTSRYSGNYLLQRYGGAFPQHGNYGFYRRYGLDGRGAASADLHNFPGGDAPDTDVLFM